MTVQQFDKNGDLLATYNSIEQASGYTNISERKIKRCLSGELLTGGGFVWKKQEDLDVQVINGADLLSSEEFKNSVKLSIYDNQSSSKLQNMTTAETLRLFEEFLEWKNGGSPKSSPVNGVKCDQEGLHVVAGCIHLPAHNKRLYDAFLNLLSDVDSELKGIHLIGDILDCNNLSSHSLGNISSSTLSEEYELANKALDMLDEALPKEVVKNYIWGNHEERYTRVTAKVDMAKFGGALLSPTIACKFKERGYSVQENYTDAYISLGNYLDLIHGQYTTTNPAKKHLDAYKKSVMFAHTHKIDSYFDADKASFNIGWMGDKDHSYFNYASRITKASWQNGFSIVHIDSNGYYHVQQIHWYNDRFYYGGKCYK